MQTAWPAVSGSFTEAAARRTDLVLRSTWQRPSCQRFSAAPDEDFHARLKDFFATLVAFVLPLPVSDTPVSAIYTSQVFPQSSASPLLASSSILSPHFPSGSPSLCTPVQPWEPEDDGLFNAAGRQMPGPPPFFFVFFLFSKSQRILTTTEWRQRGETKNAE